MTEDKLLLLFLVIFSTPIHAQPPPFLLQTTPVQEIPFYYPVVPYEVYSCNGTNEGAQYQPWPSYYITPNAMPTDNSTFQSLSIIYANASMYPVPEPPIECFSSSQLRNGSCTSFFHCVYVMNGTINDAPQCPKSMYCCMLPTCALIINQKVRYGHCRPARTCPGIFDTVHGASVGCPDPVNSPCCVAEEVKITCPRNYDPYANALIKSYGLLNATNTTAKLVATTQRLIAWAPYLLSVFDDAIGMCVKDCHKMSFLQFLMNVMSEMFMFTNGSSGLYKRLLDWKGVSMGLLPTSYFSYYSPYVFSEVIRNLFRNYNLVQMYGDRSFLTAARIVDFLNQQAMGTQTATDYTKQFTLLSWRSYKYFARFSDCAPIFLDGLECSKGQGLCSVSRMPALMNVSEYWNYCPKNLQVNYGDCPGYPSNVVCCAKPYKALQFGANLVKSEFNDVVVAVHEVQHKDSSLISDLVKVLTNASAALYRATQGRAYFRTVTILSYWNGSDGNATYETYKNADIKVVPEYFNQARALSLGSCGEPGLGVFLSQNHIRQWGSSQTIAKLFAMNRWGFGDEVPSTMSELLYIPDDYRQGSVTYHAGSSCSANMNVNYQPTYGSQQQFNLSILSPSHRSVASFAFRPDLFPDENAEFCATTTLPHCDDSRRHNPEPNTPHNRICNRTSTLTAILQTSDFDLTQNSPRYVGNTAPVFKFRRYNPIINQVIAVVADFSGSVPSSVTSMMLNALISFLQIVPDEVHVILVSVGPEKDVVVQSTPLQPLGPYLQPTGGIHFNRQRLIEQVKHWMYFIRPVLSVKNTSVLKGIESLVDTYLPRKEYRLKILCISDFFGVGPSDTGLMSRIQEAGYSIWPVSLWSTEKHFRTFLYKTVQHPLYHYIQLLANSTYGRWQFIADTTSMLHWYYALGTFLDDNNLGTPILIEKYSAKIGENITIPFQVPAGYTLNTSIVVDHDALLIPVTISGSGSYYQTNCTRDDRGFQKTFRVACRFGNISSSSQTLNLNFGKASQIYLAAGDSRLLDSKTVTVMIVSRAVEFGAAYTGDNDIYDTAWIDPWRNRVAALPDTYPKAETRLTKGVQIVFERSRKFRFPKVFAILSLGPNALLGCQLEYDLYLTNYSAVSVTPPANPPGPTLQQVTTSGKMYDDGLGEDGYANDGVYTALLVNAIYNGSYSVHVRLKSSSSSSCSVKPPGVAIVGYANDNTTVNLMNATSVTMSFYKSAGAFDVYVPPGTQNVFPLGLVTVHSCGVRDTVMTGSFAPHEQYRLPANFTLYCNVIPLTVESRYGLAGKISYNLAIAEHAQLLNQLNRYWSNVSAASNGTITKQPDGRDAITLALNMAPNVVSPQYYAVVWATDNRGNYATRSELNLIVLPTFPNHANGRFTDLPLFTDITTPYPRPDDDWPSAIIFSCIAGSVMAIILILVVIICFGLRRPSPRLLQRHHHRPPYGYVDDNRLSVVSSYHSGRPITTAVHPFQPVAAPPSVVMVPPRPTSRKTTTAVSPAPPYMPPIGYNNNSNNQLLPPYLQHHPASSYQRRQQQQPPPFYRGGTTINNSQTAATEVMAQQNQYTTNLTLMGTADRQNLANLSRQSRYNTRQF